MWVELLAPYPTTWQCVSCAGDVTTISGSDAQSVDDILKDEERLLANQRLGRATKMLGLTDDQVDSQEPEIIKTMCILA